MFRKLIALALCLVTVCSAASAAEVSAAETAAAEATESIKTASSAEETPLFPKVNTYTMFSDVGTHWALPYIKLCYETDLMKGQGGGRFAPDVSISNAEIATLAARIHAAVNGTDFERETVPWYKGAVDYLTGLEIPVGSPNANATRQGFFQLLAAVVPNHLLLPINSITLLPDTADPTVLKFYNAGILTGVDAFGTFNGEKALTRGECAAMVARVVEPTLRRYFVPAGQVPASPIPYDSVILTVNGTSILFEHYSAILLSLMEETHQIYIQYGLTFDWEDGSLSAFFKKAASQSAAAEVVATAKAKELGCPVDELALTLFGPPTKAELEAYAKEHNFTATSPDSDQILADMLLEYKLHLTLGEWVDDAVVEFSPVYDLVDAEELWDLFG